MPCSGVEYRGVVFSIVPSLGCRDVKFRLVVLSSVESSNVPCLGCRDVRLRLVMLSRVVWRKVVFSNV